MDDDSFLRALDANPSDDTLRRVYADWLEERGDDRGEFLRVAVALRGLPADNERFLDLLHRLRGLRSAVPAAWLVRADRSLAEDDVREVVFGNLLGEDNMISGNFLQVEGRRDPSPYLLARLSERYPGLLPASAGEMQTGGMFDKQTGERGCLLSIDDLKWVAADRCDVHGHLFWDGLMAAGSLFQVGVRDGWWAVLGVSPTWIS
jgi:uncharacterized protein (TIGR02996 family)